MGFKGGSIGSQGSHSHYPCGFPRGTIGSQGFPWGCIGSQGALVDQNLKRLTDVWSSASFDILIYIL